MSVSSSLYFFMNLLIIIISIRNVLIVEHKLTLVDNILILLFCHRKLNVISTYDFVYRFCVPIGYPTLEHSTDKHATLIHGHFNTRQINTATHEHGTIEHATYDHVF